MCRTTLWAVPALLCTLPVYAQEGRPIAEIVVTGPKNTPVDLVRLTAANAGIKEGVPFSAEAFTKAQNELKARGIYASVLGRTETTDDRRVRVLFEVFENPVISTIRITGNRSVSTDDINRLAKPETEPGKVLNRRTLAADIVRIQRLYGDRGLEAVVADELDIDPKTGVLTIPITETVVERIVITGLIKTRPDIVRRELRTREGEPLNYNRVNEDLSRLLALRIFQSADILPPEPGSEIGRKIVTFVVQEQRTGQVGVSLGYGVRQRLTGTLSLTEQNFRGRAEGLSAEWTVSGGIARNSYNLSFSEPWIDRNGTSLGVSVYDQFAFRFNRFFSANATDGLSNDQYYEQRKGGALRLSRPLTADRFTRAFTSVRTEKVRANNLQQNYSQLTDDQINNIRGALVQNADVNAVTLGLSSNPVDNAQDPSRGYFLESTVELGASRFDFQKPRINPNYVSPEATPEVERVLVENRKQSGAFAKYSLDMRRYISLNGPRKGDLRQPKRVLAIRSLLATARGNIPFSEQYFLGGADNLRGYFDDRFWGNNLFLLSSELRLPMSKDGTLTGVGFIDIGDAWGATDVNRDDIPGFSQHSTFRPNVGYGVGIRVRTPVGPVRLDFGFGQDGRGRSHFSISQTF
jgi:outer membrane protein insertion porin family